MKRKWVVLAVVVLLVLMVLVCAANQPADEENVQTKTYEFLLENGFTPYQASGIMAAIKLNSNFDPAATSVDGSCFGLLQWTFIRRELLEEFADECGKPVDDFDTQLLFVLEEVNPESEYYTGLLSFKNKGYAWTDFQEAATARQAAEAFCMLYDIPYKPDLKLRGDVAEEFYELYN